MAKPDKNSKDDADLRETLKDPEVRRHAGLYGALAGALGGLALGGFSFVGVYSDLWKKAKQLGPEVKLFSKIAQTAESNKIGAALAGLGIALPVIGAVAGYHVGKSEAREVENDMASQARPSAGRSPENESAPVRAGSEKTTIRAAHHDGVVQPASQRELVP